VIKQFNAPIVYVNMVGAQDELIYDGGSFARDAKGKFIGQCARFEEDLNIVDFTKKQGGITELPEDDWENLRLALVLGLKDFIRKTGFKKIHLGLSGGIDSALVACLAVDALGPMNVTGILLPGPFTSEDSNELARELASNLDIATFDVSIVKAYETVLKEYEKVFGTKNFGLPNENLQARLRGLNLMMFSNREHSLLLSTSNKSEIAVGFGTLYGDLCGGLMPIGDLLKTEVFQLAEHYNIQGEVIPKGIISRPPTAELRENQKDEDSLPPYPELDGAIRRLVMEFQPAKTPLENRVLDLMMKSEFKRWQAPPILKISDHGFGTGRRFPIAHCARG
jgi:NAD+ synthase (glutamine-hydrolysing)